MLSTALDTEQIDSLFGADFAHKDEIFSHFEQLVGLTNEKPFECVGTIEECRAAFLQLFSKTGTKTLNKLLEKIPPTSSVQELVLDWNNENYLSKKDEAVLRKAIS